MIKYTRMKYGHERREWVKTADEVLPHMKKEACRLQNEAAEGFEYWNTLSLEFRARQPAIQAVLSTAYREAHSALLRVLYYEGMRRANLPEGVE